MKTRVLTLAILFAVIGGLVLPVAADDKKKNKIKQPEQTKQFVQIQITNNTGKPVEMILLKPDGTQKSFGQVQPGGQPASMQTYAGAQWQVRKGDRVIQAFTATLQPLQTIAIGQAGGSQNSRMTQGNPVQSYVPPQPPINPSNRGNGPAEAQEFMNIHNQARAQVGVPPLRWSNTLARYAQQWADNLAATGGFAHRGRDGTGYGENIFGGSNGFGPADAARSWLSEKRVYRDGPVTNQNFGAVGHYTQMVWRTTTEVGYGFARGRNGVIVVANYGPGGNITGQAPY